MQKEEELQRASAVFGFLRGLLPVVVGCPRRSGRRITQERRAACSAVAGRLIPLLVSVEADSCGVRARALADWRLKPAP